MIRKNDDDKTTTQPKRERERERERESVLRTRVINHPNNRDTYQSRIRVVFAAKIHPVTAKERHA